ncbi:MAG: hypothetical protein EA388_08080 [Nitriliruptor sp.]|nr:MAG: hypothetical protein EA388_08080 [Nitriliruptor sp.]
MTHLDHTNPSRNHRHVLRRRANDFVRTLGAEVDTEDLLQEVDERTLDHPAREDLSFQLTVLRNLSIDHARRAERRPCTPLAEVEGPDGRAHGRYLETSADHDPLDPAVQVVQAEQDRVFQAQVTTANRRLEAALEREPLSAYAARCLAARLLAERPQSPAERQAAARAARRLRPAVRQWVEDVYGVDVATSDQGAKPRVEVVLAWAGLLPGVGVNEALAGPRPAPRRLAA